MNKPQVIILCGGQGTRLREHTQTIPKALVEIGGRPILWHIMKLYRHYGFDEFLLCLGYKGELIREYVEAHPGDWTVNCIDTGADTQTGGRVLRCLPHVKGDTVFVTYGDGLADIDLRRLLAFHRSHGLAATITCVNPESPFGIVEIDGNERVIQYKEKPKMDHWISGGFFVFDRRAFGYLQGDGDILERCAFESMVADGQVGGYRLRSFWTCMDTYKDTQRLNELWKKGTAPWKVWPDKPARRVHVPVLG